MGERYDFAGLFQDSDFLGMPPEDQGRTLQSAWGKAVNSDPELGKLDGPGREQFLTRVYEKHHPQSRGLKKKTSWGDFAAGTAVAEQFAGPLGPAIAMLRSPSLSGTFARGAERGGTMMAAGIPTFIGQMTQEMATAPLQVTKEGYASKETVAGLTDMAQQQGIESPKHEDLVKVAMSLDPEAYDIDSILRQLSINAEITGREEAVYEGVSPIANWIRQFEAPVSPAEAEGGFAHQLAGGAGTMAAMALPTVAAAAAGVPAIPAVMGPSLAIGTEEASRPIEEKHGRYDPSTVIPSAIGQAALEAAGGPEVAAIGLIRRQVVKKIAAPVTKEFFKNAGIEGFTEGAQKVLALEALEWTEGEREFITNLNKEQWKEVGLEAGLGAILGGVAGGGVALAQKGRQLVGEEAVKAQLKYAFQEQEAEGAPSYEGRLPPSVDEARQTLSESAPPFLLEEQYKDQLKAFAEGTLTEEDIAGMVMETGGSADEMVNALEAAEASALDSLGISSREEIGQARPVPGQEIEGTLPAEAVEFLRADLRERAVAARTAGDTQVADVLDAEAATIKLTGPATQEELAMHQQAANRGTEIMFSDSRLSQAGLSVGPGVVVVDRNAAKGQQVKSVMLHEMGHQLKITQPEAWTQLQALFRNQFSSEYAAARARVESDPEYQKQLKGMKPAERADLLMDEIVAQVIERNGPKIWIALGNEAKLADLYKKPGRFGALLNWFVDAASAMGRTVGINVPSRGTYQDYWRLAYETTKALNINLGAPRSILAPEAVAPVSATEATPSAETVVTPQVVKETPPEAAAVPETAPTVEKAPKVVPIKKPVTEPAKAPQETAPPVQEKKAAATRKKRSRKKRKTKRKTAARRRAMRRASRIQGPTDVRQPARHNAQLEVAKAIDKVVQRTVGAGDVDPQVAERFGRQARYATRVAGFYAPSSRAIVAVMENKGQPLTALPPKNIIPRLLKQDGVTQLELDLFDLENYINDVAPKDHKDRVILHNVKEFIDSQGIIIEEVVLNEEETEQFEAELDEYDREEIYERAYEYASQQAYESHAPYTMIHREGGPWVVRWRDPDTEEWNTSEFETSEEATAFQEEMLEEIQELLDETADALAGEVASEEVRDREEELREQGAKSIHEDSLQTLFEAGAEHDNWTSVGGVPGTYREILFIIPGTSYMGSHHSGQHYGGPERQGVVLHIRFQQFVDTDGMVVLFIDEIQSDWYSDLQKRDDVVAFKKYQAGLMAKYREDPVNWEIVREDMIKHPRTLIFQTKEDAKRVLTKEEFDTWIKLQVKAFTGKGASEAIQDAPMVSGSSNSWIHMAAKRLLRYAASRGIRRVAWTPAELQIKRSKARGRERVDQIKWDHDEDGNILTSSWYQGKKKNQYDFDPDGYYLGDPYGAHGMAHIAQLYDRHGQRMIDEENGTIAGERVYLVGGKMFRMIYDDILPATFKKAAKELGLKPPGQRVSSIEIEGEKDQLTANHIRDQYDSADDLIRAMGPRIQTKEEAQAYFDKGFVIAMFDAKRYEKTETTHRTPGLRLVSAVDNLQYSSPASSRATPEGAFEDETMHLMAKPKVVANAQTAAGQWQMNLEQPQMEIPEIELTDEFINKINDEEFRMHFATRQVDPKTSAIAGKNDQVLALDPGAQWGMELGRAINSALAKIGTDKTWKDYQSNIADHFRRLKDLQDELIKNGVFIPEGMNVYLHEELMYGKTDLAVKKARAKVIEPLTRYMNAHGITEDLANTYLRAMHAFERNRRGYEINVTKARERERANLAKGGLAARKAAAEIKAIDEMIKAGMVPGSGTTDRAAFTILQELVDSGELIIDLDSLAQTYGYESLDDALNSSRRQQYKAHRKWKREHWSGELAGKYGNFMTHWMRLTQEKLRLQRQYNLVGQETYDNLLGMYQFYAPLKGRKEYDQGDIEDILRTAGMPSGAGEFLDIRRAEDKSVVGRLSHPQNSIVGQALQDLDRTIVRGEKNVVGNTFLKFAKKYLPESLVEINKVVEKKVFDRTTGSVKEVTDFWYNERPNVFATKEGDEVVFMTIKDERLAIALKGLGEYNATTVAKLHGKAVRIMAQLATSLNPDFWISNAARDIPTAILNSLGKEVPISDKAILKMVTQIPAAGVAIWQNETPAGGGKAPAQTEWGKWWQRSQKAGMKIGYYGLTSVEDTFKRAQREIHWAGKETVAVYVARGVYGMGEMIESVNTSFENGTRLVAFRAAIEAGASDKQAASIGRNLTVNFNRHGSWRGLSSWYMFANASIQGVARMFQALGNRRVFNTMTHLSAISFMLARWNREVLGEDDDGKDRWDNLSRYHKNKRLLIAIPLGDRKVMIGIPMPHGYSVFHSFGVGVEELVDSLIDDRKNTGESAVHVATGMIGSLTDSFNPLGGRFDSWKGSFANFVPTVPRIFWDLATNEDFAGRAITPKFHQQGTPWYQTTGSSASNWSVWSSKMMNWTTGGDMIEPGLVNLSPDAIDFLLKSAGGGLGRFITDSIQTIQISTSGEVPPIHKIPFLHKFLYEGRPDEAIDEYYTLREQLWKVRRDFDKGDQETKGYIRENYKHMLNPGLYKQLQSAERARKAAKQKGDREAETKAMLTWLKLYNATLRRTY